MLSHLIRTPKRTIAFARVLRRYRETSAEHRLWTQLRGRKLHGLKFRRQVPIGPFIVDFLCAEVRLAIELDGDSHDKKQAYDKRRTSFLEGHGYHVLRFQNDKLYEDLEGVLEQIARAVRPVL